MSNIRITSVGEAFAFVGVIIFGVLGLLAVAFGFSLLLAYPVKWLWNSSVVEMFNFKEIDVWMAWKLSFLASLLFKPSSWKFNKES